MALLCWQDARLLADVISGLVPVAGRRRSHCCSFSIRNRACGLHQNASWDVSLGDTLPYWEDSRERCSAVKSKINIYFTVTEANESVVLLRLA